MCSRSPFTVAAHTHGVKHFIDISNRTMPCAEKIEAWCTSVHIPHLILKCPSSPCGHQTSYPICPVAVGYPKNSSPQHGPRRAEIPQSPWQIFRRQSNHMQALHGPFLLLVQGCTEVVRLCTSFSSPYPSNLVYNLSSS